ncbi:MAG TPA: sigma 54-interacting transcriptional regulator [Polyangiaceae bacterium]
MIDLLSAHEEDDASSTTFTVSRSVPPAPLSAALRIVGDGRAPFRLKSGSCVVGSSDECDVVIDDPAVSRKHLELQLVPEGVRVVDLDSRNGTFYLGQQIERMVLGLGTTIEIGAHTLAIDFDAGALEDDVAIEEKSYRGMVGVSLVMRRLFGTLKRLGGSLATVLVHGESGTGKELIARAIHEGSRVAKGPFVVVNCGALARDLVASELFGHRRGAFTGAVDSRRGAFELANDGTLFLDEVGELPLEVQPLLLRAIEAREIREIGGEQTKPVRVRIVAATNRRLEEEVAEGRFRQDLYYRLAVVKLEAPPLRGRPEDVGPIALRFAEAAGLEALPAPILEKLKARAWPGNVRELRNAVDAYAALGVLPDEGVVRPPLIDSAVALVADPTQAYEPQKDALIDLFTRAYLQKLMAASDGNQSQAARVAGLDRSYFGRLLTKHGLRS